MTAAPAASRRGGLLLALVVAATTLWIDLASKAWAWNTMRGVRKPHPVIDPWLQFDFSFNTGSAFGFLGGVPWARTFFIVVTLAAIVYVAYVALHLPPERRVGFVAVGLVAAGAIGNLHDRLVRADELGRHGVVDFIRINYPWGGSWPTFNVADVVLLAGVGLLFIGLRERPSASDPVPAT
jgi:signal peptidase II